MSYDLKYADVSLTFEDGTSLQIQELEYINRRKLIDKVMYILGDEKMSGVLNIIIEPVRKIEAKYMEEGQGWYVFTDGRCDTTLRFETDEEALKHVDHLKGIYMNQSK